MIAISVETMRELEKNAIKKLNIPSAILMENAAYGFVTALKSQNINLYQKKVCVVCGKGNNGGDGYAIARLLFFAGAQVEVFSVCDTGLLKGDAAMNFNIAKNMGIPFTESFSDKYDIVVDAIFGTGFYGDMHQDIVGVVDRINKSSAYVASVDIPSGIAAKDGQGTNYVNADLCVTFAYAKTGHFIFPGKDAYKELVVVPISVVDNAEGSFIVNEECFSMIPKRQGNSHKGTYGKALAFVGSDGMAGAAILSGSAVLKSGTGMLTVATDETIVPVIAQRFPSAMTFPVPIKDGELDTNFTESLIKKSQEMNAILIGCGLGQRRNTKVIVKVLIEKSNVPMVIDADGLNILSENIEVLKKKKQQIVLTPHVSEFSRLSGYSLAEIKEKPLELAKEFAKDYGVTLILKDAVTVIADQSGNTAVCPAVNSGMATAGSGDVLAGLVTGLISQTMTPYLASVLAVYIHSSAGKIAKDYLGERGMTSFDILENVPKAFMEKQNITPFIKEL